MRKGVKPWFPQQVPPGTQEKITIFQSRLPVMKDGVKTLITESGGKGVRGLESAKRILMTGGSP